MLILIIIIKKLEMIILTKYTLKIENYTVNFLV